MSVLLRSDDRVEESGARQTSPLAGYAAAHWVAHAQDEKVRSSLRKAMEYLFDLDKPYFAAWVKLYDIDIPTRAGLESTFHWFSLSTKSGLSRPTPLYYAALCGFQHMVEHLVYNNSKQVDVAGGYFVTPFVAALQARHFQTATFLHDNGADPNPRGYIEDTPLHSAALYANSEMVQILLKYKADVHARNNEGSTPLHFASRGVVVLENTPIACLLLSNIARQLLENGADVNARDNKRFTPLHEAAQGGRVEVVQMLLEHGADVGAKDEDDRTALEVSSSERHHDIMKLLGAL